MPQARPLPSSPPRADATQREGARLERLLGELGRTLDQARGPAGRAPDRRLPSAEDVEERGSLEVTPEVGSLEARARSGRARGGGSGRRGGAGGRSGALAAAEAHAVRR